MKKEFRIKNKIEIDTVFARRKKVSNKFFSIYYLSNKKEHFRFAMSIGRKYGRAYERNLAKRRIRAIVQEQNENILSYDFVIVIKKESKELSFNEIKENIINLLKESKIIKEG